MSEKLLTLCKLGVLLASVFTIKNLEAETLPKTLPIPIMDQFYEADIVAAGTITESASAVPGKLVIALRPRDGRWVIEDPLNKFTLIHETRGDWLIESKKEANIFFPCSKQWVEDNIEGLILERKEYEGKWSNVNFNYDHMIKGRTSHSTIPLKTFSMESDFVGTTTSHYGNIEALPEKQRCILFLKKFGDHFVVIDPFSEMLLLPPVMTRYKASTPGEHLSAELFNAIKNGDSYIQLKALEALENSPEVLLCTNDVQDKLIALSNGDDDNIATSAIIVLIKTNLRKGLELAFPFAKKITCTENMKRRIVFAISSQTHVPVDIHQKVLDPNYELLKQKKWWLENGEKKNGEKKNGERMTVNDEYRRAFHQYRQPVYNLDDN